ncbi:MAG: hypothetical protein HQ478_09375 [Chloroflexi bacterium]|nr:hypothetical protein [Chloroflexota bacterium]
MVGVTVAPIVAVVFPPCFIDIEKIVQATAWAAGLGLATAAGVLIIVMFISWVFAPSKQRDESRSELRRISKFLVLDTQLKHLASIRERGVRARNVASTRWGDFNSDDERDDWLAAFPKWQGEIKAVMEQVNDAEADLYATLDLIEAPLFESIDDDEVRRVVRMYTHHCRNIKEFIIRHRDYTQTLPPSYDVHEDERGTLTASNPETSDDLPEPVPEERPEK